MIVGSPIAQHARTRPEDIAIVFDKQTISWRALEDLLRRAAAWIRLANPSGRNIAIHLPNCPALAIFFFAAARLGREAQILDPQWPRSHTVEILSRLSPGLAIANDVMADGTDVHVLPLSAYNFEGLRNWLTDVAPIPEWPAVNPHDSFYVGFTSGSTGLPKGYRRNHHSWIVSFDAARREFGLDAKDVIAAPGALTHSLFLFALAWAAHEGATCLLAHSFKPSAVIESLPLYRASALFGVPAQLGMISRHMRERSVAVVGSLRWLISSGAKWSSRDDPALRALFPNARFAEFYGASETSFISIAKDGESIPERSVGRAFAGVDISIIGPNNSPCRTGASGRIFVRSDMIFDGYASGADAVARRADGAICVGDIGFIDENRRLFLTGRENRMIVTSGKNLFPEEVERALELNDGVEAAAVIAIPDGKRGEKLLAILQPKEKVLLRSRDIIAHARRHLPLFKVPRDFAVARDWPLTRSGKTDFEALKDMYERNGLERLK